TAFGFVVFCDTQSNPDVVRKLAEFAYAQRPAFTLVGGDLVSDGTVKEHWTGHFFPNMEPLNTRVPLVPILGNHDKNAHHFYDYFTLPEPEHHYQFDYGDLSVFMLDSEKSFRESGDEYRWLDTRLRRCKAVWKIVMMHKPAYSSDEDDYGDTANTRSVMGDMNARRLVPLYEKHGVDIVWSGHIHSYERTWPLKGGKAVSPRKGVVYLVTGGGGGGLEKAGPVRAPISAKVYSGHHYCYAMVNGKTLRMEAYDLDNRLFDWLELSK
ncbi:MAG: metallophosphoesterase, partial [Candidatus Hydrogenedens sp.]|nr:metallophosphoesterase [Candidatus Hydrogenedens sp.]